MAGCIVPQPSTDSAVNCFGAGAGPLVRLRGSACEASLRLFALVPRVRACEKRQKQKRTGGGAKKTR